MRDVDVEVAVQVTERRAFADPGRDGYLRPDIRGFLLPENSWAGTARNDIQIAVAINIINLHVVGVRSRQPDEVLGPNINPRVTQWSGILIPLGSNTVGRNDVQVPVAIHVTGLQFGPPRPRDAYRVFRPARILIPEHAAASGAGDERVNETIAVDIAQRLVPRIGWVRGIDYDMVK